MQPLMALATVKMSIKLSVRTLLPADANGMQQALSVKTNHAVA
jgi:hypothetical protein